MCFSNGFTITCSSFPVDVFHCHMGLFVLLCWKDEPAGQYHFPFSSNWLTARQKGKEREQEENMEQSGKRMTRVIKKTNQTFTVSFRGKHYKILCPYMKSNQNIRCSIQEHIIFGGASSTAIPKYKWTIISQWTICNRDWERKYILARAKASLSSHAHEKERERERSG